MKKIPILILLMFGLFIGIDKTLAADSASISINAGKSGSATLTVNSSDILGQVYGTFSCGKLGSKNLYYYNSDGSNMTRKTYTITWNNASAGNYNCSVSGLQIGVLKNPGKGVYSISANSKSFTINNSSSSSANKNSSSSKNTSSKTTNNNDNSKSADNNLKSLSVEGAELSFNKDTTTYNLSVGNDVKKIKINAEANNSKATITGTGEKDVKEGDNKFDVVVTAENGDTKTYTINVNVDSKPITVTVGGKKYTLVKKKDELPELAIEHEDLTLNFDDQEVAAYRIDKINFVLVGLRDEKGNIKLYKYDTYKDKEKPDKYTLFMQFSLPQMFVSYLEFPKDLIPDGFKKYKEKINGEKVDVYKLSKGSDYCLFYGVNMETGEKNIYKYDTKEKTFQIYDREELESLEKQMEEFKYIIAGLIGFSALLLIIIVIICATRKRKFKKMIQKYENKKMAQL